jgi:NAD(P)-dependent dehydrogenase (short-subunit alcohol dehydrogenase family)
VTVDPGSSRDAAGQGAPAAVVRRFEGRVAVITGASRGIGLGIARRLVAEGARVVITARTPETLAAAAESLGGPEHARYVAGRADDDEHRRATIAATLDAFGRIDVLVNNTGINPMAGPITDVPSEVWTKLFGVNVAAPIAWTEQARRGGLGEHDGAAVVNVASIAGVRPSPPIGAYGASKAALIHVTGELAVELAPRIRVNAVAPAVVKTKFATLLYEGREAEVVKDYPLGRLGDPRDVAAAVAFLASDDASWITGQTVIIDGGLTLQGAFA